MKSLQRKFDLSYLFISHDLAVVRHMADHVGVMYLGRLCEVAPVDAIFDNPIHPYTRLLLETIPDVEMTGRDTQPVAGEIPNPIDPPGGCTFHPRCTHANDTCRTKVPELNEFESDHFAACFLPEK
jgi:peptide/nickel transport system ATP-binding protein